MVVQLVAFHQVGRPFLIPPFFKGLEFIMAV
jgi:hypothetical protein